MGDKPLALAKAMLALGVKRFKHGDLEVEFHDSALAANYVLPEKASSEAYRKTVDAEELQRQERAGELSSIFRSAL